MAVAGQDLGAPRIERRCAVLGHPVAHSLSPVLHRAAYAQLGLAGWGYGLQDVTEDELPAVLAQLDRTWGGLSLTMPLKQAVMPHLDTVDPLAQVTGAVNTVVVQPGGAGSRGLLVGFNTDVHGIAATVREAAPEGWRPAHATVLGARATASSALAALGELGTGRTTLVGRALAGPGTAVIAAQRMGVTVEPLRWTDPEVAAETLLGADLVVSTVPAGAADAVAAALTDRLAGSTSALAGTVLLDVVYAPWPSPLTRAWSDAGGRVAPGWGMLLHQAQVQVRLMTGREPDLEAMRAALVTELDRRAGGGEVPASPPVFALPERSADKRG